MGEEGVDDNSTYHRSVPLLLLDYVQKDWNDNHFGKRRVYVSEGWADQILRSQSFLEKAEPYSGPSLGEEQQASVLQSIRNLSGINS